MIETAEIKALVYVVLAGGMFFFGWHCKGIVEDDKAANLALAQAKVVETQLAANQTKITADAAVAQQVQQNYEQRLQASTAANATLNGLLRQYEISLSAGSVPAVPGSPASTADSSGRSGGITGFNQAVANAISSCTDDSNRLQGWQDWYRGVAK